MGRKKKVTDKPTPACSKNWLRGRRITVCEWLFEDQRRINHYEHISLMMDAKHRLENGLILTIDQVALLEMYTRNLGEFNRMSRSGVKKKSKGE